MMTITLTVPPEMERRLQEKINDSGQSIEDYLRGILQSHLGPPAEQDEESET